MSAISGTPSGSVSPDPLQTRKTSQISTLKFDPRASANDVEMDTVEISDQAREMLEYKPFSVMNPKKVLHPDSEEEKKFRELLKTAKTQKSDIMTQIEDALKAAGISTGETGPMKLEVDRSGKIVVGGMKDKKTAQAIEEALNKDKTLGKKIKEFQHNEKELSKQLVDYTGCSLYELTMTQQGDINKRVRAVVEEACGEPPRDEYYWRLSFLGETKNTVVSEDDVAALGFGGPIDFSGEVTVYSEPEKNIRETMNSLNSKINEAFGAHNDELTKRLEAAGVTLDDDYREKYFLDLSKAKISVDNHGAVTIEGMLSKDERTHQKGVEMIEKLVREMVNETEQNSYHLNIFTEASDVLLKERADKAGLADGDLQWDAKVVAEINNGVVGHIGVSVPAAEAGIHNELRKSVNALIADAGITLSEPVEIAVDDSGKIRATNLVEGTEEAKRVEELLERINEEAKNTEVDAKKAEKEEDEKKKDASELTAAGRWQTGMESIAEQLAKLRELRR